MTRAIFFSIVAIVACVFIVVALILPSMGRPREMANVVKCANNLCQIGVAIREYAARHDRQLPPTLAVLLREPWFDLPPYVFVCPSGRSRAPDARTPEGFLEDLVTSRHCDYVYLGGGLTTKPARCRRSAHVRTVGRS